MVFKKMVVKFKNGLFPRWDFSVWHMYSYKEQAENQKAMKISSIFLHNNTVFFELQISPWPVFLSSLYF